MEKRLKIPGMIFAAVALIAFLAVTSGAFSLTRGYGTFAYHSHNNSAAGWSKTTVSLIDEATQSVTTGIRIVEACIVTIEENAAATQAHLVICDIPDQATAANQGKIILNADTIGGATSGTTKVSYAVFGYGSL